MTDESLPSLDASRAVPFRAVLTPHRSLSRAGFILLMSAVSIVSIVIGIAFLVMGAWPVLGFFGLDVALIYLAFRLNYRAGREHETIVIADNRLTLVHTDAAGRSRHLDLNPAWVAVRLREAVDGRTTIALASHGREYAFARFLNDDERREFAGILRDALLVARGGPRI